MEKFSDRYGRGLRYGESPNDPHVAEILNQILLAGIQIGQYEDMSMKIMQAKGMEPNTQERELEIAAMEATLRENYVELLKLLSPLEALS